MSENENELGPLFDAIKQKVKDRFGSKLNAVEIYEPMRNKKIKSPAVLIELVDMKTGGRNSGGLFALNVEFVAHCILSMQTENVAVEVSNFAAAFVLLLDRQKWGLSNVENSVDVSAAPGMFKPDDNGFESMAVSWVQTVHIGNEWELPDFMPTDIYLGEFPNVGADNLDSYEQAP